MKAVFWLPALSMHFSAVIRALGDLGHEITVASQQRMPPSRQAMARVVPNFGSAELVLEPTDDQIRDIVRHSDPSCIHIPAGIHNRFDATVLRACLRYRKRAGAYIEAPHPDGMRMPFKLAVYAIERLTHGRAIDFLLPLGRDGARWYQRCGYSRHRLFPCTYVPDYSFEPVTASDMANRTSEYQILFLGRCIPIKRVDVLIRALACQKAADWRCTMVGDGSMAVAWQRLASQLGLARRISFVSSLPHIEAMNMLRKSDLLVLPSSHDGWGVVVNEALMSGVPAICSDRCGAADLLTEEWRGGVFRTGSVKSLAQVLERWIRKGSLSLEMRARIQEWSKCISSAVVARHITDVWECVYRDLPGPAQPWLQPSSRRAHLGRIAF